MRFTRSPRSAGFTLVELLITILLVAEVLIIAGLLFDLHNKTSRVQVNVAEMQQSLRVAQREMVEITRMAGRGGLPAHLPPPLPAAPPLPSLDNGLAVEVDNNAGNNVQIVSGQAFTKVVPGTDVLRVRGVFDTPIYQILSSALDSSSLVLTPDADNPGTATDGALTIRNPSPSGFEQDLSHLVPPTADGFKHRALLLVSPLADSIYAVVSIDAISVDASDVNGNPTQVTIAFKTVAGDHAAAYRKLFESTGNLPNNLSSVAFAGLLEEHVFYVREQRAIPGDASSELQPKLTRERVHPGTAVALDMDANRDLEDLADNILDLQVALGFNSNLGSLGFFDRDNLDNLVIQETANGNSDDWLFNGVGDDASVSPWVGPWSAAGTPQPELFYVRISTLARTDGRDFQYVSRPIDTIEDRDYSEPADSVDPDRRFRRRLLETIVDLRNI